MAATGHALKKLATLILIFVFILKSFHLPDSDSKGQTILRSKVIVLNASEMTSVANYEVFVPNSTKISVKAVHVRWRRSKEPRNRELYSNT